MEAHEIIQVIEDAQEMIDVEEISYSITTMLDRTEA